MKEKIIRIIVVLILGIFSFYYTDKVIEFVRQTDPIMKKIKKESNNYYISAVNAKVVGNKIIPGVNGKDVDYENTYNKMKRYGTYNESLTVFKEITPTISVDDYYDKYISMGNGIKNDVSLVFIVKGMDDISQIITTLNNTNAKATFFIDGLWFENNESVVNMLKENGHEIEILSYDNKYDELYFTSSLNRLNRITNIKPKYCFAKYDSKDVLELCSKLQLHTIIPTINTGNYPYSDVKKKIKKGSIISFDINSSTKIELATIINYIKQRGYIVRTLDDLLSESVEEK